MPTPRDNMEAAAELVRPRTRANLEWRRDPAADALARQRATELLTAELTPDAAVSVAFLVNPGLQIALEELSISRAQLVAAVTPPNPTAVIGARKPGGDLAVFYPERAVSIGVLVNVISLLNMPDRAAIARLDLQRARYAAAQQAVEHVAKVVQAWVEYSAALQSLKLLEDGAEQASAAELIGAELTAAATRARLGELMGVTGWRDDWRVPAVLPPLPDSDPDSAMMEANALKQRLDLQAASKAVDVRLRTLAMQRRFRWVANFDAGLFRDKVLGGTSFTGPNAMVEIPLLDQRIGALLQSDAELHIAVRQLEAAQIAARTEIRIHLAELKATRRQLEAFGDSAAAAPDVPYVLALQEYWRARSALAFATGDWAAISGL